MKLVETELQGLFMVMNPVHQDARGSFFKPFEWQLLSKDIESFFPKEIYYSSNFKRVIRGMHFQSPPHDHAKLVWVSSGKILDVVLDMRNNSVTYGKWYSRILDPLEGCAMLIPSGFAHGFLSLDNGSIVNYAQTSGYCKESDGGIRFDSFGFRWPEDNPIVSERDCGFPVFSGYRSEFV